MPQTPILGLPYPVPSDPADVPHDLEALADGVEAAWMAAGPGEFAYAQRTTSVSVTTTTAVNVLTADPFTLAQPTIVVVSFYCANATVTAGAALRAVLIDNSVNLGFIGLIGNVSAGFMAGTISADRRVQLAAGAHTIAINASLSAAGTGVLAGGGGTTPDGSPQIQLRVTRNAVAP